MEQITYRKTLDVHKNGTQFLLQGFETEDKLSRVIEISLMASGDAIDFPIEGMIALMYVTTPGATEPSINECIIKDNKVVYEVLPIVVEGLTSMQLKLIETTPDGATNVLASPKFAVEVTKSDALDEGIEQTETFTALEQAVARAKAVYDGRFLRMELTSDCIFRAYYAGANDDHGAVYETDILKELFHNGNVLLSESFAHGGTGVRAGEDKDNSMYYSNVSKSEALNAKDIMKNSEEVLEEVRLHGVYTAFSVNFETGEVQYVSPSFKFNINKETGELEAEGQTYEFHPEVMRAFEDWLENNGVLLSELKTASGTHTTDITSLKSTTSNHTSQISTLSSKVTKLQTEVIPPERGGTGYTSIEELLDGGGFGDYINSYQKTWNIDENVGRICVNTAISPTQWIYANDTHTDRTPIEISFPIINTGRVKLNKTMSKTSGWPNGAQSDYWYNIDYYVNDEKKYHYQNSSADRQPVTSGSDVLDVKKGDVVTVKFWMSGTVNNVSSVGVGLSDIWLEANIETPYKYISLPYKIKTK